MATYYIDLENGNDSNDGTSFANRRKTIESFEDADAANDEFRFMASPDPTLIGSCTVPNRWCDDEYTGQLIDWDNDGVTAQIAYSTTTGATQITRYGHGLVTGDTIFIKGNTNTNSDINGTWEVTRVDDNNFKLDGYTSTLTSTETSDLGRWRNINSLRFLLANAVTQTVASTGQRSAWTASSNVTCTLPVPANWDWTSNIYTPDHCYADEIDIADGFGTGKAAYWATGTLDLSSYQQISLQIMPKSGASPSSSNISLRLCTDTSGDTSVHTVPLRYTGTNNYRWIPNVKDFGSNLNSAIKSVAIYVDTDEGAQAFRISNVIACKASSAADSLTHQSLIGLNTTNDPFWYEPGSIVGKRVMLQSDGSSTYPNYSYYAGRGIFRHASTGDTQNLYKRETIKLPNWFTSNGTKVDSLKIGNKFSSGTHENEIKMSGGWNRTDMSSKATNGITWVDNNNLRGELEWNSNDIDYENFGFTRFYEVKFQGYRCKWTNINVARVWDKVEYQGYSARGMNIDISQAKMTAQHVTKNTSITVPSTDFNCGQSLGTNTLTLSYVRVDWGNVKSGPVKHGNNSLNIQYWYADTIDNIELGYNSRKCNNKVLFLNYLQNPLTIDTVNIYGGQIGSALSYSSGKLVTFKTYNHHALPANPSATTNLFGETSSTTRLPDYSAEWENGAIEVLGGTSCATLELKSNTLKVYNHTNTATTEFVMQGSSWVKANKWDGTADNDFFKTDKGTVSPETSIRKTASGKAWKFDVKDSDTVVGGPLSLDVAKVAVNANALVTVKLWVYRDGTGVTGGLKVKSNIIMGITAASAVASGSASTWEEVTLTFTPTVAGFAEIEAIAYYVSDASHNLYIDDISITQA